jgi:hypothetical protein
MRNCLDLALLTVDHKNTDLDETNQSLRAIIMKLRFPFVAMMLLLALAHGQQSFGQSPNWQPVVGVAPSDPNAALPVGTGTAPVMAATDFSAGGPAWQPAVYSPVMPVGYSATFADGCSDPGCTDAGCTGGGCTSAGCSGPGGCTDAGCSDLGCNGGCCAPKFGARFAERFPVNGTWGSIDFMHVWTKGRNIPPLVTTSPATTLFPQAGVLPAAQTLFGGRIGEGRQSAGRLDVGFWLDQCHSNGIGFRFFAIEGDRSSFYRQSDGVGVPILATPYIAFPGLTNQAIVAAHPTNFAGSIGVQTDNDILSAEAYGRFLMIRSGLDRIDMIGGYHYAQVSDSLTLVNSGTALNGGFGFPIGTVNTLTDRFDVRNDFHGGVLGLTGEFHRGCWTLRTLTKVSVGDMRHSVTIDGVAVTTVPPPPAGGTTTTNAGGIFAQRSNIGTRTENQFTYIPELNLTLGYKVTPHVELTAGYNFMYFPHVALAGDHIDTTVDFSQANPINPVGARPLLTAIRDTDFWVQGVSLGANWTF